MAKAEIYTKAWCPYCVRAMKPLASKGVEPIEYDVTMGGPKRAEMQERAPGAATVPQVFVNDQALGGCDDIHALDRAGKVVMDKTVQVVGAKDGDLVTVYRGVARESYSCAPECAPRITLGDDSTFFGNTLQQSGTRTGGAQAAPPAAAAR